MTPGKQSETLFQILKFKIHMKQAQHSNIYLTYKKNYIPGLSPYNIKMNRARNDASPFTFRNLEPHSKGDLDKQTKQLKYQVAKLRKSNCFGYILFLLIEYR